MGKTITKNKKAYHDYEILETLEAGIVLKGSEVKSLRMGRVNLKDSFIRIIKGEAFLMGAHITYADTINPYYKPDEKYPRKLLLHRKQIDKLIGKVSRDGLTIVALSMYFNSKNLVKIQIAIARGKSLHDKRESIKKREADIEARAAIKRYK